MELNSVYRPYERSKAACLVKMMANFIGPPKFKQALNTALTKFEYGNMTREDFWQILLRVSGENMGPIMKTWIESPGFPLLTVKEEVISNKERILTITQEKYTNEVAEERSFPLWIIPIPILTSPCACKVKLVSIYKLLYTTDIF